MDDPLIDGENLDYAPSLAEYSDTQLDELSDEFWRRLTFAKEIHATLQEVGVSSLTPQASIDDGDVDITFSMASKENNRGEYSSEHVSFPEVFNWEDAPLVVETISEHDGEIVDVTAWKHESMDVATLDIGANFSALNPD